MITNIICILIGAFIGWNVPRPEWAANIQRKFFAWVKFTFSK